MIEILRHRRVNTLDQPQMVHAFYGVRTGFIRRGDVSFFTWLGQLAGVVVSCQERCILDDWGAECRMNPVSHSAVLQGQGTGSFAGAGHYDDILGRALDAIYSYGHH